MNSNLNVTSGSSFASENKNSEYGNEIEEIISNGPPLTVKWGTSFFLLLLLLICFTCWFIRYPDIVGANAKLTSINAPKEVKAKVDGKLVKLFATEALYVDSGQILAYIESRADHSEVLLLSKIIDSVQIIITNNKTKFAIATLERPFQHLGEMQQAYQIFMQSFILFKQYMSNGYYYRWKGMLRVDISYLRKLHTYLSDQKTIQLEDFKLADTTFEMNKRLREEAVIAALEYRNEKSKLLFKAMAIPQINSNIITNESSQHEKQKEIAQIENQIAQQVGIFIQALNTFKASLDEWKSKYCLIAPLSGKVAFSNFMQENQQMQANQTICFINPQNSTYYVEILVPQYNFGKVAIGQTVLLKFPSFPSQEYGVVKGKINFVSRIPSDSGGYYAKVVLPYGLATNYHKYIQYRDGLTARAEVITNDMNLLQRFYFQIIQQFDR